MPIGVELGDAGRRLWVEMTADGEPEPLHRTLLLEACRISDRLERLARQLDGGQDWLTFDVGGDATEVTVIVDRALSEARQQAIALKQIVAELRQQSRANSGGRRPAPRPDTAVNESAEASGIADLTARIAARRASPTD